MILSKLGKFLCEWVLPILVGFAVMFSLSFSTAWVMSYVFLDLIFALILSDMGCSFDVTSDFFRLMFCSSVSLLAIMDRLHAWMTKE